MFDQLETVFCREVLKVLTPTGDKRVNRHDRVAPTEEPVDEVRADEPTTACNENPHRPMP